MKTPAKTTRLSTLATTTATTTAIDLQAESSAQKTVNLLGQPAEPAENQTVLTACVAEVEPLRYTPVGLPALNLVLEHASDVLEAGQGRQVKLVIKAVAFGAVAERLVKQPIGSVWRFTGFLATPRRGKSVVLHVDDFCQR